MAFIYIIPPTGGWLLDDMSQPATFIAGTGIIGPKGEKGDKGDQGEQGIQGIQGIQGDKGDKGDTGPQGPSGVVSATTPLAYDSGTKNLSIDLSGYLALTGGTMSGDIAWTNGQFIGIGVEDFGIGGYGGLSLVCSVGYDLNWQSGWLTSFEQDRHTGRPLYVNSGHGSPLRSWDYGSNSGIEVSHTAITFADLSAQTTAFKTDWSGSYQFADAGFGASGSGNYIYINGASIQFPDLTAQTTAFIPADYTPTSGLGSAAFASTSDFYPSATNPAGYLTSSALTDYATETFVTSQGYITSSALTPYLTISSASATYQTISGMASYALLSGPTFTGVPKAPTAATSDNTTQIATTAFVKAQGYLTSAPVTSVAGRTGAVTLSTSDISGLGTAATFASTAFAHTANNLSDLASASTARTNLGLGTMATATASDYAALASANTFTANQLINVNTATGVGLNVVQNNTSTTADAVRITNLGAGNSFVVEDSTNPDSSPFLIQSDGTVCIGSTTPIVAGYKLSVTGPIVSLNGAAQFYTGSSGTQMIQTGGSFDACTIENRGTGNSLVVKDEASDTTPFVIDNAGNVSVGGTLSVTTAPASGESSTKVPTAAWTQAELVTFRNRTNSHGYLSETWTSTTSGTGATTSQNFGSKVVGAPTLAVGYSAFYDGWQLARLGTSANDGFDWTSKIDFVFRINRQLGTADSNSLFRVLCGKATNGYTVGDLANKGIGIRCVNGAALQLQVHNGTTLTNVTSTYTPTTGVTFNVRIYSDGAGNVTLFVNGSQVATTSAGPTGATAVSTGNGLAAEVENIGILTGTKAQIQISNYQVTID